MTPTTSSFSCSNPLPTAAYATRFIVSTMLGLFVNDGTPLLFNPSTNRPYPSYRQNLVFPPNTSVIEYLGEPFSDVPLFQGDIVNPGVDDLAAFHARSALLPQHRTRTVQNLAGPYSFQLTNGSFLDASLSRCTASCANHGSLSRGQVRLRTNCIFS